MTGAKLPGLAERRARVRGVSVRYFVGGEGPSIVLVHGLGGGAANWVEIAPVLARSRRVLCPDLPGHAGSSPLRGATLRALAEVVAALVEEEEMAPAVVVGHSLGGVVALWLAAERPDRVRGVVLAGAAAIGARTLLARAFVPAVALLRPGRLVAPARGLVARSPWLRRLVFGGWGASRPAALSPAVVEGFLAPHELHTGTRAVANALLRGEPLDLGRVRCPCLVLWGARDRLVPLTVGFEYARRLGAPVRAIADCGHLLIGERPDACIDAIEDFLDRVA